MLNVKTRLRRLKRKLENPQQGDQLRLHLGSGNDYWHGWVNIDASQDSVCDVRSDFTQLRKRYADGSIAEVAMIHSLSYLPLWAARDLLLDLYALLKPDGKLTVELPDLSKCARRLLETEGDLSEYLEAVRGIYAFGLEHLEQRRSYAPYPFGWSAWHLKRELETAGFQNIVVADPQTHGPRVWRDIRVEATK